MKSIIYRWIPSHVRGNEKVDKAAKKSLHCIKTNTKIPHIDLKQRINKLTANSGGPSRILMILRSVPKKEGYNRG